MPKIYLKDLSCYEATHTSLSDGKIQNIFLKYPDGEVFLNFCKIGKEEPHCLLSKSFGGVLDLHTAKTIADVLNNFNNYIKKIKECQQ